jgi:hypothetical protein
MVEIIKIRCRCRVFTLHNKLMPPPDLLSGTNLAEGDDDKLWINLKHLVRARASERQSTTFFYRASQNKYGSMFSLDEIYCSRKGFAEKKRRRPIKKGRHAPRRKNGIY